MEFEKSPYKIYERGEGNHEPTDSYFYLARQLAKFMMRADALNLHVYPVSTEITGTKQIPISNVCSMNESESEEFLVEKKYLRSVLQKRINQKASF